MPGQFWDRAIKEVKQAFPEFIFIAEAYWDTEWQLQQLGFDFAYDKRLYDRLHRGDAEGIRAHLKAEPAFLARLVHFIENHDEARAADAFGANHPAAAMLALGLPGLRLVHEGQMDGFKRRVPVQLIRRPVDKTDKDTAAYYRRLLPMLGAPAFCSGDFRLLEVRGPGAGAVVVYERREGPSRALVLVNLSAKEVSFEVPTDFFNGRQFDKLQVLGTGTREHLDMGFLPGNVSFGLKPREGLLFVADA
jgi:glycosidase